MHINICMCVCNNNYYMCELLPSWSPEHLLHMSLLIHVILSTNVCLQITHTSGAVFPTCEQLLENYHSYLYPEIL